MTFISLELEKLIEQNLVHLFEIPIIWMGFYYGWLVAR